VDCALNFNVGIVKRDGEITTDPVKVRRAYLRGWFAIDLVTSVPFGAIVDIFTNGGSSSRFGDLPKTLRVVRILRLFKLFRMFKLLSLMKRWQGDDSVMFVFLKALTLALVMILTTHLLACVWAFTAVSEANDGLFNTDSWPVRYLDYTHVSEMQSFHAYLHALYWSVITVTTVGYGDRVPVTDGELMITIFSACSGVCVFGYLMGSVSSVITHENSASLQLKARINELIYWMDVHNLPKELKKRIRRHYTHVWKNCGVRWSAFVCVSEREVEKEGVSRYRLTLIDSLDKHTHTHPHTQNIGNQQRHNFYGTTHLSEKRCRSVPTYRSDSRYSVF